MKALYLKLVGFVCLLMMVSALPVHAHHHDELNLFWYKPVVTKQLDKAWVNRFFTPGVYQTIVLEWGDFEYRDVHAQRRGEAYEIDRDLKSQLRDDAIGEFRRYFDDLHGYDLVDYSDATPQTMIVRLNLVDIVNHVPDDTASRNVHYVSVLGEFTLDINFVDATTGTILFYGEVTEKLQANGLHLKTRHNRGIGAKVQAPVEALGKRLGASN